MLPGAVVFKCILFIHFCFQKEVFHKTKENKWTGAPLIEIWVRSPDKTLTSWGPWRELQWIEFEIHPRAEIFHWCAASNLNHAAPDYLVRGTDRFSLRLSNKKNNNSQHNSHLVWMNQNYTYFLSDQQKYIFWY